LITSPLEVAGGVESALLDVLRDIRLDLSVVGFRHWRVMEAIYLSTRAAQPLRARCGVLLI
jgi:hypothetical protein